MMITDNRANDTKVYLVDSHKMQSIAFGKLHIEKASTSTIK